MGEKPEKQLDFLEEEKPKPKEPEYAPRICQYCEDSGICDYCARGREEKDEMMRQRKMAK